MSRLEARLCEQLWVLGADDRGGDGRTFHEGVLSCGDRVLAMQGQRDDNRREQPAFVLWEGGLVLA